MAPPSRPGPPPVGLALALVLAGLLVVLAVQLFVPPDAEWAIWARVGAATVALLAPLAVLLPGLRRARGG